MDEFKACMLDEEAKKVNILLTHWSSITVFYLDNERSKLSLRGII